MILDTFYESGAWVMMPFVIAYIIFFVALPIFFGIILLIESFKIKDKQEKKKKRLLAIFYFVLPVIIYFGIEIIGKIIKIISK